MERNWTNVGAQFDRTNVEKAIASIKWRDVGGSWPAVHGLAIEAVIKELRIPKVRNAGVSSVPIDGGFDGDCGTAWYELYAIEGHYKNGRAIVYVVDQGSVLTPVRSDFWPAETTVA